jgi:uncharacterized protein YeaO (DUF488 family)
MIFIKRAYEPAEASDGPRFLVDRLWPRGRDKKALRLEAWVKDVAPSQELRTWFAHDPEKWKEFQRRYLAELEAERESWKPLLDAARKRNITLVYGARDSEHNNAVALRAYLTRKLGPRWCKCFVKSLVKG